MVQMSTTLIDGGMVNIVIVDNGKGFDTAKSHNGRGLNNIDKRIVRINGSIAFTSVVNSGTGITLQFTLPKSRRV
jgi:two-component system NarL family sensor kinase